MTFIRSPFFRTAVPAALCAILALSLPSCGEDPPAAMSLSFASDDIRDGVLPIAKDAERGVLVGVVGHGADGSPVDLDVGAIEWSSSDPEILDVRGLGEPAVVTCLADWFDTPPGMMPEGGADAGTGGSPDAGTGDTDGGTGGDGGVPPGPIYGEEPAATLVVRYGEVEASIEVRCILNAAGNWRVVIDGGAIIQDLSLKQNGRTITYEGTSGNASGTIDGDAISLAQQGFMLTGTFTSRDEVSGTYTGPGGISGAWTATRRP
jgi:hypothetical protein